MDVQNVLSFDAAFELAAVVRGAIDRFESLMLNEQDVDWAVWCDASREQVMSDVAGLLEHYVEHKDSQTCVCGGQPCSDARRYSDGLRRTAALYGVYGR